MITTLPKMHVFIFAKHALCLSPTACPHLPRLSLVYIHTVSKEPASLDSHVCVWGSAGLFPMCRNEKAWQALKLPRRNCLSQWFTALVSLLTDCQTSGNWSQPKWGPLAAGTSHSPESSVEQLLRAGDWGWGRTQGRGKGRRRDGYGRKCVLESSEVNRVSLLPHSAGLD